MSAYDIKQVVLWFVIGFLVGGLIMFLYIKSTSTQEFILNFERVALALSALFTTLWTYKTFGKSELREEAIRFIEALNVYQKAINNELSQKPLYEILKSQTLTADYAKEQLQKNEISRQVAEEELKHLYDTSTHIPNRIRADLLLNGGFFLRDYEKDTVDHLNQNIFRLKETLRKSVRRII